MSYFWKFLNKLNMKVKIEKFFFIFKGELKGRIPKSLYNGFRMQFFYTEIAPLKCLWNEKLHMDCFSEIESPWAPFSKEKNAPHKNEYFLFISPKFGFFGLFCATSYMQMWRHNEDQISAVK